MCKVKDNLTILSEMDILPKDSALVCLNIKIRVYSDLNWVESKRWEFKPIQIKVGKMSSNKTHNAMIARIVASYATRTDVTQNDIVGLLSKLKQELLTEDSIHSDVKVNTDKIKPALPIDQAVTQNQVFCLCCGKGFKMLKRHLGVEHGLNESEYRKLFDLPEAMPLVAPSYSDKKAAHAKQLGLGKYHREASNRDEAYTE